MDDQINEKFDRIITLFVQELRNRLGSHLKEAILFGSKARGDDAPDSDYMMWPANFSLNIMLFFQFFLFLKNGIANKITIPFS